MMELTDAIKKLENLITQPEGMLFTVHYYRDALKMVLEELQAERAKPKVWDGAPNDAVFAAVSFKKRQNEISWIDDCKTYTRELPKTRADELAEECANEILKINIIEPNKNKYVIDHVKSAILKAQAEWEAGR